MIAFYITFIAKILMLRTDSADNINITLSELYVLFMQNNDFVQEIGLVIKEIFGKVKPNGPS